MPKERVCVQLIDDRCPFRPVGGPEITDSVPVWVDINQNVTRGLATKRLRKIHGAIDTETTKKEVEKILSSRQISKSSPKTSKKT